MPTSAHLPVDNADDTLPPPWTAPARGPEFAPARVGQPIDQIDTPALLIDIDALDANIAEVHRHILGRGLAVRAHGKAHKSPDIARRQIAAGAVGICCQKASEAEVFAAAGIQDILITNQLVGAAKVARAARLARQIKLSVCVDDRQQVAQLGAAAQQQQARIGVFIEVDIGHQRCGVTHADAARELAHAIQQHTPWLTLAGIHAFRGSAQHMRAPADRAAAVDAASQRLSGILAALQAAGLPCPVVTGGGTGTYPYEAESGCYTEVQPGSYALMDVDYASNRLPDGQPALRHALFGLCSVISVHADHAVLDGGLKAFAVDQGPPRLLHPGWSVKGLSDEHTTIVPDGPQAAPVHLGDKLRLIPGHCDPTVNLHDWLMAVRDGQVAEIWPIAARGAVF